MIKQSPASLLKNWGSKMRDKQLDLEKFAANQIAPIIETLASSPEQRLNLYKKMSELGLFSLTIPKKYNGMEWRARDYVESIYTISKTDAGIGVSIAVANMVAEAVLDYGSAALKQNILPRIAAGELIPAAFAITEKQAASDIKSIQTTAAFDGNQYYLQGDKQFVTNGDVAKILIVLARVQPDDKLTAFLVEKGTAGLTVTKKEEKIGLLSASLVDLHFDKMAISKENILGEVGEGMQIVLRVLDNGRLGIAAQALGIGVAAYECALHYSKQRIQFGKPIAEHQAIAFKLADMYVNLTVAKEMIMKAAFLKDIGDTFTVEASVAKLFSSERCQEVVTQAMQIYGAYSYIKDCPLERYWRDARATTIYEGTSEIQRMIISRHILEKMEKQKA